MTPETVRTAQGTLRGRRSGDGAVTAYKGVPYARPPVGEMRWRAPEPAEPWNGVRPALAFAAHAPQPPTSDPIVGDGGAGNGAYSATSEDCLYLNVWTGADDPDERRPVMVWLHHGAFRYGGPGVPMYEGESLARSGVVVVTVAYRLGRLGFLAHPELSAETGDGGSGNYGLLDQVAALRWVQENVAGFGGDPGCVTIFGLSAGSASVNLLMASPLGRGLFHRAICQSAALMAPPGRSTGLSDRVQTLEGAHETGVALGRALGCASIEELRRVSAADLMAVSPLKLLGEPSPWKRDGAPVPRGALDASYPVLDGTFLPRAPAEIFAAGEQADVPLLAGSAAREFSGLPYITDLDAWVREAHREYGDLAERFLALFGAQADDLREVSGAARGDRVFVWQNWSAIRAHARSAHSACFYYHWSYVPPVPPELTQAAYADKIDGAFHGVELPYVFRNLDKRDWSWGESDRSLRDAVSAYWINFARSGDPNGGELPLWPAFDVADPLALHFDTTIGVGAVPHRERLDFWDDWFRARSLEGSSVTES